MSSTTRFRPGVLLATALLLAGCGRRPGAIPDPGKAAPGDTSADFQFQWASVEAHPQMAPSETVTLRTVLHNEGSAKALSPNALAFAYHWRDAADPKKVVVWDGARTVVAQTIAPGADYAANVKVVAPIVPGRYILEMDLVREGVAWASQKGVPGSRQEVLVK